MALAGRVRSAAAGAKAVNELVNIPDFYRTHVAPDIQSTDANLVSPLAGTRCASCVRTRIWASHRPQRQFSRQQPGIWCTFPCTLSGRRTHLPAAALQSQVLRADSLKFLTTFRFQIPKADVLAGFPGIVQLLGSESNVVHSQAAMCIEQLLSLKVSTAAKPWWQT